LVDPKGARTHDVEPRYAHDIQHNVCIDYLWVGGLATEFGAVTQALLQACGSSNFRITVCTRMNTDHSLLRYFDRHRLDGGHVSYRQVEFASFFAEVGADRDGSVGSSADFAPDWMRPAGRR